MGRDFTPYVEICHCGHNKATHFEEKHTCLGMLCDCKRYTDRDDPLPSEMKAAAPFPNWENDFDDIQDIDDGPITLPMIPIINIPPHPHGCPCAICAYNFGVP